MIRASWVCNACHTTTADAPAEYVPRGWICVTGRVSTDTEAEERARWQAHLCPVCAHTVEAAWRVPLFPRHAAEAAPQIGAERPRLSWSQLYGPTTWSLCYHMAELATFGPDQMSCSREDVLLPDPLLDTAAACAVLRAQFQALGFDVDDAPQVVLDGG